MKNFILFVFFLPTMCFSQTANVYAETQNVLSKNSYLPILKGQADYFPQKVFGFSTFFRANPTWGEGIMSLIVAPQGTALDVFNFTAGLGIEHASMPVRMMTSLFIKKKLYSGITIFEFGGSGW